MEKRAKSLEMQSASRSWKNQGNRFSDSAYQSNAALPKPDFNLRPIVDFWSEELLVHLCYLKPPSLWSFVIEATGNKCTQSSTFYCPIFPESLGKVMLISKSVLQPDSANPIHAPGGSSILLLFWPCDSYLLWISVVITLDALLLTGTTVTFPLMLWTNI